jgi:hypothetical protein
MADITITRAGRNPAKAEKRKPQFKGRCLT